MLKTKSLLNLPSFWKNTTVYKESELVLNPLLLIGKGKAFIGKNGTSKRLPSYNGVTQFCTVPVTKIQYLFTIKMASISLSQRGKNTPNNQIYKLPCLVLRLQKFLLCGNCVQDRSRDASGTRLLYRNEIFRARLGKALQKLGNITAKRACQRCSYFLCGSLISFFSKSKPLKPLKAVVEVSIVLQITC